MQEKPSTKVDLFSELNALRRKVSELEKSNADLKAMNEVYRKSHERFNALYADSLDCIYEIDFQGQLINANPSALQNFGYDSADIPSLNLSTFLDSDHIHKAFEHTQELISTGHHTGSYEYRVRQKNGTYKDVEAKSSIVYHHGKPVSIIGVLHDVSDLKRSEAQLRFSEEKFSKFFMSNPSLSAISEFRTGRLIDINEIFTRVTGYTRAEAIGKTTAELDIWVDDRERDRMIALLDAGGTFRNIEAQIRTKSGDVLTLLFFGEKLILGEEALLFTHAIDVTQEKEAAERLRESEARYRGIVENIVDVYYRCDTKGRMIMISPSGAALLGYDSADELVGRNVAGDLYYDLEERRKILLALQINGTVKDFETTVRHKDGTPIAIALSGRYYYDGRGDILGMEGVFRDIRERKQREQALFIFRYAVKSTSDAIGISDPQGQHFYQNQAFTDLFGYTVEELNRPLAPLVLFEDAEVGRKLFDAVMRDGSWRGETTMVDKNGRRVSVIARIDAIRNDESKLIGVIGIFTDITESKKMLQDLKDSERKYRFITEKTTDIVWVMNMNLRTIYVSPSVEKMLGFTPEERIAQDVTEQVTPASLSFAFDTLSKELELENNGQTDQNRVITNEMEYYHKDGSTRWGENVISGIRDDRGVLIGLHGVTRDITEQKKAEILLKKINLSLSKAQRIAHIGNWERQFEKNEMYWSDEIYRIIGRDPGEIESIYPNFIALIHPDDRYPVKGSIEETAKTGIMNTIQHRIVRNDGSLRDVLQQVEPMHNDKGDIIGMMGIVQDVTEWNESVRNLHITREQLLQAEKLSALGQLSAGVAHEILNPLNVISMALQMWHNMDDLPEEILEEIDICMRQIDRILSIADNLKQLSRVPDEKRIATDINSTIDNLLALYNAQLKLDGIEIEKQYGTDLPNIVVEPRKIEQVMINLISNARDAMIGGKNKVLRVKTDWEEKQNLLRIIVADTGTGIKREHMRKLFEPFFTTKEPGKGTGLGLSISYGIVKDHGGEIRAENNEWGGASFYIGLPIK